MSLIHVICFGLKVVHFFFSLCYRFFCLILLTWLNHGGILNRKIEEGKMWLKVWNQIIESFYRIHHHCFHYIGSIRVRMNWWRIALIAWLIFGFVAAISCFWFMSSMVAEKRREILASMCDERARMLQDQFNVSMNHIQAMSVMISIFHHSKNPSAIDQRTFAKYTETTSFERPLTSGVAYAVRVLHEDRERFEAEQGWIIKRMDNFEQTPVQEDPENLEISSMQEEYGPVIFAQDTVAHVISFDVLSGKEDLENVVRARESGKGVLTAPFRLLKTNRLGVILTFAIYKTDLPPNPTVSERIQATAGYLGGIFDIESLVEKLLHQLASKQAILVNVYDTTDPFHPISMYGSVDFHNGLHHVSVLNFGDPFRKHEMHCRFQQKPSWPWVAITTSLGGLIIVLLIGHIFHATMNRIAKVKDDYQQMMELKRRAEDADIAKSQFLATVSHEIRTPMNGVLGMLQMLRDTKLDDTQEDYVRTAGESGKALVSLINEVLDQAKIESGKLELEAVTFNLRTILDDVLSLFSGKYQGNNVEIAVYVSNKVPATLVGDPGRFRQIVMNLVGNSIKFTEKGHVFVTVHLVEEVAELESEVESTGSLSGRSVIDRRKSWAGFRVFNQETQVSSSSSCLQSLADQVKIIVSVEDTGQGIPLEAQSKVFNPFMQVGPSITRTHGGTGIGLSISKYLVHLMKGEIGLASLPQVGSTFTFTAFFTNGCPDYTGHETGDQLNSSFPEFSGMRALLLDTNPIRAKVSKYHIERLGIKVEVLRDSNSSLSTPVDMFFMEEETLDNDSCFLLMLLQKLRNNQKVKPKFLVLTNSTCSTRATSDGDPLFVVIKPLRASMLASYLHRAMGVGNRGNSELKTQPLTSLLSGRRILVVDDNPVNLKVAAGALKKYGAEVVHAESGKDAVSLLTPPHRFNACFMDVQMPEMDGFQATRRIREVESSFNNGIQTGEPSQQDHGNTITSWRVPILAMTADVIQATNEKCSKYGMDGYVSKPFEAEQLYREVSRFFQTSDGNQ